MSAADELKRLERDIESAKALQYGLPGAAVGWLAGYAVSRWRP